jgi:serine/threonine protein kinase
VLPSSVCLCLSFCLSLRTQLGKGPFGEVFVGKHKRKTAYPSEAYPSEKGDTFAEEWEDVAIKETVPNAMDLRGGRIIQTYDDLENHCEEIKALKLLRENGGSPGSSTVLHLHEYFMSNGNFYMVTERLGQELEEWRKNCEVFSERMAISICRSILNGISFLASKGVVHRDINSQNILFRKNSDFRTLTIVDFGLACVLNENDSVTDFCGSIGYIAPEIYLRQSYRYEVDLFAFGVLLFKLLSCERPFPSNNDRMLQRHTIALRYNMKGKDWEDVSASAKDMVRRLLINRQERLTAEQALEHQWFSEGADF